MNQIANWRRNEGNWIKRRNKKKPMFIWHHIRWKCMIKGKIRRKRNWKGNRNQKSNKEIDKLEKKKEEE